MKETPMNQDDLRRHIISVSQRLRHPTEGPWMLIEAARSCSAIRRLLAYLSLAAGDAEIADREYDELLSSLVVALATREAERDRRLRTAAVEN